MTLNVCLGRRKCVGGELVFDEGPIVVEHAIGRGIVHLGSRAHHARELSRGSRSNLILWCGAPG